MLHQSQLPAIPYRATMPVTTSDVPVKPTWPNADADIRVPHDEEGSIVSQPSARELPVTELFVVARATRAGEKSPAASPRAARSMLRANAPTPLAVPKRPACPA